MPTEGDFAKVILQQIRHLRATEGASELEACTAVLTAELFALRVHLTGIATRYFDEAGIPPPTT